MASLHHVRNVLGGWHQSVDLLICGYGAAGASAAIEAHDRVPDARILIVEKAPEAEAGGNCRVSGQSLLIARNPQALARYQHRMSESNPLPAGMVRNGPSA